MSYASEILESLETVPSHIAGKVLMDIDKRITDWLASGGKEDDPYIYQQVRFAKNVANRFGTKQVHDVFVKQGDLPLQKGAKS